VRESIGSALLALFLAAPPADAQSTLSLDPGRSRVEFTLGATLHTVHGELDLVRGELRFGPDGGAASGEVVVDARSARTGIDARDRQMHEAVLESQRFPEIVLRAEQLEVLRRDATSADVRLHGTLEIHGAAHAVAIPATVRAEAGDRVVVEARFRVPYVEWGLRDVSNLVLRVAKDVEVSVRAEGRLSNR
jgi:polyisoprenoid-binding protein YceI